MSKFKVTKENAEKVVYILKNLRHNASAHLKDSFGLSDKEIEQVIFDYNFGDGYKNLLPKKKIKRTKRIADRLRKHEIHVHVDNMNISIPQGLRITYEALQDIEKLCAMGYTKTNQPYLLKGCQNQSASAPGLF